MEALYPGKDLRQVCKEHQDAKSSFETARNQYRKDHQSRLEKAAMEAWENDPRLAVYKESYEDNVPSWGGMTRVEREIKRCISDFCKKLTYPEKGTPKDDSWIQMTLWKRVFILNNDDQRPYHHIVFGSRSLYFS